MGKDRANEYCDVCKKIHRKGKCTELSKKEIAAVTPAVAMAIMKRATTNMYLSRDRIGDDLSFTESDVVKEDDKDESGRNSKKNK